MTRKTGTRYKLEIWHQSVKRVKTKNQKVLGVNFCVCISYRGKTGRGVLFGPPILNRVKCKSFQKNPLEETIDIAINLIFSHIPNLNITRKKSKNILLFATSQTQFIFNSKFHNQIDEISHEFSFSLCPC